MDMPYSILQAAHSSCDLVM